jgi:hypothetical protein
MGTVDLRNIKWLTPKYKTIFGINDIEQKGLISAKKTFEDIDEYIKPVPHILDLDTETDLFRLFNYMRLDGLITYDIIDDDEIARIEYHRLEVEKVYNAYLWLNKQPKENRDMITILMDSVSTPVS